ncbi:hypothetical protein HORIV_61710 [Vreelandella olivaria]|uniref:Uncharacterized protein n=1 Tax=Vreelandella olivaria TaxID=390919 RepID=A0ABM7GSS6_9GAMM|nr:hypothetical protein HORIV_61710 [Halomonas olivaria]
MPTVVEASHWRQALDHCFESALDPERTWLALVGNEEKDKRLLRLPDEVLYAWEGAADALDGVATSESSEVWDEPLHRRRWQFGPRLENRRTETLKGER